MLELRDQSGGRARRPEWLRRRGGGQKERGEGRERR
jgi:hypothetical protein